MGKQCEKAQSFVNTINIDYNFGEYFNRCMKNPFEIRDEMSNQLYDALYNNNNLAVAQEIDTRVACLNNLIQDFGAQEIQADVDLLYGGGEIATEFKNAFASGTTIYRRKREIWVRDFPTLELKHADIPSSMVDMEMTDPGMSGGLVNINDDEPGEKKKLNQKIILLNMIIIYFFSMVDHD